MINTIYGLSAIFMFFCAATYAILVLRKSKFYSKLIEVSCGKNCLSCGQDLGISTEEFIDRIETKSFLGERCLCCKRESRIRIIGIGNFYGGFVDKLETFCMSFSYEKESKIKMWIKLLYFSFLSLSIISFLISICLFPLGQTYRVFLILYNFTISIYFFIDILAMFLILRIKWID